MNNISVVIQAGGKSKRMGEDKALINFQNMTMIEYILKQIDEIGNEIIIISNQPEKYQKFGRKVFSDILPNHGALGGIFTAIHHSSHPKCLLLACDMPFVNIPFIEHMISFSMEFDIVVPRLENKKFVEPFRAIYSKACLTPIQEAIENGEKRVISFFKNMKTHYIEHSEIIKFDPDLETFFNVNTPKDLKKANRIAKKY